MKFVCEYQFLCFCCHLVTIAVLIMMYKACLVILFGVVKLS